MPELGETKRATEIGKKGNDKYIWYACEGCGKERWVTFRHRVSRNRLCYSCAHTIINAELKDKVRNLYLGEEEFTIAEIARRLGHANDTIKKCLVETGIRLRTWQEIADTEKRHGRYSLLHRNWKGGRIKTNQGYVQIYMPGHPRATKNRPYAFEHILVWEKAHGHPLPNGWVIHHINAIRDDNRPKNLLGMPRRGHSPSLTVKEVQKRLREVEAELAQQRLW